MAVEDMRSPGGGGDRFEHLGLTLTVLRLYRGLSQAQLAERCGIRSNQISRYETGQVLPQLAQLDRILDGLRIDFAELVLSLDAVRRLAGYLDAADRTPAEAVARRSVATYWAEVSERQLELHRHVCQLLKEQLEPQPTRPPRRPAR